MKILNKGFTLVEMLATIIMISIVMSLLLSLINIVKREDLNTNYTYQYELNKLKFIRDIQNDLNNHKLISIEDLSKEKELEIKFNFEDQYTILKTSGKQFLYYQNEEVINKWELANDIKIDKCAQYIYNYDDENNNYYFKINIPLLRKAYFDNLEITYSANSKMITNNINNNIGICTN